MATNELGRIRLHKGDITGAEEALLAAHRAGWDPQPTLALVRLAQGDVATAARLHTRRRRTSHAGALEGAATQHRPAARAAARGAGGDRDRGRRHRPGTRGRRSAGAGGARPLREQSVRRQRRPRPRKGAARRGRYGRRRTVPACQKRWDSGTKSAPRTRPRCTRLPRRSLCRDRQTSTAPVWSARRRAQSSKGSKPRRL